MLFGDRSYLFQHGSRESNGQRLYLIFHIAILTLIWLHVKGIAPHPKPQTRNGPYLNNAIAACIVATSDRNAHAAHQHFQRLARLFNCTPERITSIYRQPIVYACEVPSPVERDRLLRSPTYGMYPQGLAWDTSCPRLLDSAS
jgi:hypothetical protein